MDTGELELGYFVGSVRACAALGEYVEVEAYRVGPEDFNIVVHKMGKEAQSVTTYSKSKVNPFAGNVNAILSEFVASKALEGVVAEDE